MLLDNALVFNHSFIAQLFAVVMVPVDYPNATPIFSLELNWHGKHTRENSETLRVSF